MYLSRLDIEHFKNYDQFSGEFSPKMNVFTGLNGSGKTNILDAVHYAALTKSFLNYTDRQNIQFDQEYFSIRSTFVDASKDVLDVSIFFSPNEKKVIKKNNVPYEKLADHIGLIPLIVVCPQDSELITEGSDVRRKLIDSILSQMDSSYLANLMKYNRALIQRNILLKQFHRSNSLQADSLEVWDDVLVDLGQEIFKKRILFFKEITPWVENYYQILSSSREQIQLSYESSLQSGDYLTQLKNSVSVDIHRQYTTLGIHKDDVLFHLNHQAIKKFGSQGQQKSFLIALKFALLNYLKQHTQKNADFNLG